jgi:hypothetical protein
VWLAEVLQVNVKRKTDGLPLSKEVFFGFLFCAVQNRFFPVLFVVGVAKPVQK